MICCGIWGEDKSGKSSLALSFPKPIQHFEFDLGGYDRTIWRFKKDKDNGSITTKPFVVPMQGNIDEVTIKQSKIITGVKELWYQFLVEYLRFLKGDVVTGIIDTGTLLWETICTAYLQEKQEIQLDPNGNLLPSENRLRVSLLPIEYREPNIRMRSVIYQAKAHGKHLILTHHSRDEYKPMLDFKTGETRDSRTGMRERSGFSSLGDSTDLMLHTYKKGDKFYCKVDEQSVPTALVGMEFEDPSYDKIDGAIRMIQGG